ncbi:hypothetical protein BST97_06690 [Nonlabens spongiae]|uniref:Uncharacterized protein n=1 Tax=Nonlabens spongiae TaxID=331648 RepID=A0A1W6MJR5_9FLAO|nr:hypothetical protein BST97_06690 [Nonlabens spongiae]
MSKITSFGILKAIHNIAIENLKRLKVVKDHIFWNSESNSQLNFAGYRYPRVVKDHIFWNSESNSQHYQCTLQGELVVKDHIFWNSESNSQPIGK